VKYEPEGHKPDTPVGRVQLCDGIARTIDVLISDLPRSEFAEGIEADLRECYAPGTGFAEAFAKIMARLFREYGVVLLDPLDEQLKEVASPLYAASLEQSAEIAKALVTRSAQLESAGYHAQVHVSEDMVPLFIMDDGRRVALTRQGDTFTIKGSERKFSKTELAELSRKCPNCFSPNVTLRPVVQDFLLPTAAYIGGPAEIAYFAQINAVYEVLGRVEPCVLPRASFTLVEGRHQKTMRKYGLELQDFFDGLHAAVTKVVERSLDRDTANRFAQTEKTLNEQLDQLEAALRKTDATLSESVQGARAKILYQLEHLRTKFVHSSARREEAIF